MVWLVIGAYNYSFVVGILHSNGYNQCNVI
jgi:hypothetical protein